MSSRYVLAILFIGLCSVVTGLQARKLPFQLDLALFQVAENRSRLEVYLGIDRRQVTYRREEVRYVAHLASVVLLKQRGQIVDFKEIPIDDVVSSFDESPSGIIIKQTTFNLAPGIYDLQVIVEDHQGNRSDSTLQVEVPVSKRYEPEPSNIQLASLIRRSTGPKEYTKRELTVWPRAAAVYDDSQPLLWYYAEVYGLAPLDTIKAGGAVWRDSTEVISLATKWTQSPSMVFSDWGAVNLSTLTEGNYSLILTFTAEGDSMSIKKPFRIVREAPPIPGDSSDVLAILSAAELTDFTAGLSLLWPELDMRRFRAMDSMDQRQRIRSVVGMVEGWLPPDSSQQLAELLRHWEHVKSYDHNWRSRSRLTEQGRAIFRYDLPAAIETYPATSVLREYQVWAFTSPDSTAQVIFMDHEGNGEFTLVHSTIAGAKWNENWRRELPWIAVPLDTTVIPAVKVKDTAPVIQPAIDALTEPTPLDTLVARKQEGILDTLMIDTPAVRLTAPDTAAVDTYSVDLNALEPTINDTTEIP
ncbi:hypothetical protein ACFL4K_00615 [Candidatus Neomarinimicrobiota bacterium]